MVHIKQTSIYILDPLSRAMFVSDILWFFIVGASRTGRQFRTNKTIMRAKLTTVLSLVKFDHHKNGSRSIRLLYYLFIY